MPMCLSLNLFLSYNPSLTFPLLYFPLCGYKPEKTQLWRLKRRITNSACVFLGEMDERWQNRDSFGKNLACRVRLSHCVCRTRFLQHHSSHGSWQNLKPVLAIAPVVQNIGNAGVLTLACKTLVIPVFFLSASERQR